MNQLLTVLRESKDEIFAVWRSRIRELPAARRLDDKTLNDHLGDMYDEIVAQLRQATPQDVVETSNRAARSANPETHGEQRLEVGFRLQEMVAEYSVFRAVVVDFLDRSPARLTLPVLHTINRVIDGCIAVAVDTYTDCQAELVHRDREEQLSFLVHDLRSPLAAISAAASLLQGSLVQPVGEDSQLFLDALGRNTRKLDSLIGRVLKSSIQEQVENKSLDLQQAVDSALRDLLPLAQSVGTELVNSTAAELMVRADPQRLALILQNLISNAIKYTPRGRIEVGAEQQDGRVSCWVKDSGCGISADRLARVFEKLESDPARTDSFGLGLAIVRQMARAQGGDVDVTSRPGEGATFTFTLSAG